MKNGVGIYGGFLGTETSRNGRPSVNPVTGTPSSTTLSGDIGVPNDKTDNSYHVIITNENDLNSTAVLDGFVITGGNANGGSQIDMAGGGILNFSSSPTLTNCSLFNNSASNGGGIWNGNGSSPTLTNCSLLNNSASTDGGGIANSGSSPTLINCNVQSNSANRGGGIFNTQSNPKLINCSLQSNSVTGGGAPVPNGPACDTYTNKTKTNGLGDNVVLGGVYAVGNTVYAATDGGLSFCPVPLTPVVLSSFTASPATLLTSGTTSLSAVVTGGTPAYSYVFSGPGTITQTPTSNTASVSGLSARVQTFTVVVSDATSQTTAGTVSVTVSAAPVVVTNSPFAITGVITVSCAVLSAGLRQLTFNPQYAGSNN